VRALIEAVLVITLEISTIINYNYNSFCNGKSDNNNIRLAIGFMHCACQY